MASFYLVSICLIMDPLSVAASVVGLLVATANASQMLTTLIHSVKNAPTLAEHVLLEVSSISASLVQVQGYLTGAKPGSQARTRLVMVDQIVATLTTCVMTFSKLEAILTSLNLNQPQQKWARVAWARQESSLTALLERLKRSKVSLTLNLTTLTW